MTDAEREQIGLNHDAEPFMVTWERGPAGCGEYGFDAPHRRARSDELITKIIHRAVLAVMDVPITRWFRTGDHKMKPKLKYIRIRTGLVIK